MFQPTGSVKGRRRLTGCRLAGARVVGVLATAAVVVGCGEGGGAEHVAVTPYSASLPDDAPLSRGEIDELLAALEGQSVEPPPSLPVSASVFALASATPDIAHPEWQALMSNLRRVRQAVIENGWEVLVEGFTDDIGPVEVNERLSAERAEAASDAIVGVAGYPPERVMAVGRGIGGPNVTDRRVVVSFVRPASPEESR